jgi:hypothetical protein
MTRGSIYRDLDPRCEGRALEVVAVIVAPQETKVACISRGKVTLIDANRLCDGSRFEMVVDGELSQVAHDGVTA